ncbi:MAG: integrase catalytic domain-containing protein, partial [Janthinobacterium lividum]
LLHQANSKTPHPNQDWDEDTKEAKQLTYELQSFHKTVGKLEDKDRYGGSDDILETKCTWFEHACRKAGVQDKNRGEVFPSFLKGPALRKYNREMLHVKPSPSYEYIVDQFKKEFETHVVTGTRRDIWTAMSWSSVAAECKKGATDLEIFDAFTEKLRSTQDGMEAEYRTDKVLKDKAWDELRHLDTLQMSLVDRTSSPNDFLQSCRQQLVLKGFQRRRNPASRHFLREDADAEGETLVTDRKLFEARDKGKATSGRGGSSANGTPRGNMRARFGARDKRRKTCYVCRVEGHYSWMHPVDEQEAEKERWRNEMKNQGLDSSKEAVQLFLSKLEGADDVPTIEQLLGELAEKSDPESDEEEIDADCRWTTSQHYVGEEVWNGDDAGRLEEVTDELANFRTYHLMTGGRGSGLQATVVQDGSDEIFLCFPEEVDSPDSPVAEPHAKADSVATSVPTIDIKSLPPKVQAFEGHQASEAYANSSHLAKYSLKKYHGVVVDPGAAAFSSGGLGQFKAAQREWPDLDLNRKDAGAVSCGGFGTESFHSIGSCNIPMPFGYVKFYIFPIDTPFLLSMADMQHHNVYLKNITNELIQADGDKKDLRSWPVTMKYGHAWITKNLAQTITFDKQGLPHTFLTEQELRNIHRRLGHPSVNRMIKILERSDHEDVRHRDLVEKIAKYCELCQKNGKAPGRFKFNYKDDSEFNAVLVIDVFFLEVKGSKGKLPVLHVVDEATNFQAARFLRSQTSADIWFALRNCWMDVLTGPPDRIVVDAAKNLGSREFIDNNEEMGTKVHQVATEAHNKVGLIERYHQVLRRAFEIIDEELEKDNTKVHRDIRLQMAVKAVNDSAGPDGLIPTLLVFGAYPRMSMNDPGAPSTTKRALAIDKAMEAVRKAYAKEVVNAAKRMRNGPVPKDLKPGSKVYVFCEKTNKWSGPWNVVKQKGQTISVRLPNGISDFSSTVCKEVHKEELEAIVKRQEDNLKTHGEPLDTESDSDKAIDAAPHRSNRPGRFEGKYTLLAELDEKVGTQWIMVVEAVQEIWLTEKEKIDRELSKKLRAEGAITSPGAPFEAAIKKEVRGLLANKTFEVIKPADQVDLP